MSDVQGDNPVVIGSGLLFPCDDTSESMNEDSLPGFLRHMLKQAPPIPKATDKCFHSIEWEIIAGLHQAIEALNIYRVMPLSAAIILRKLCKPVLACCISGAVKLR